MNKARKKVLKDIKDQKNEPKRMRENPRLIWKIRGYISLVHYWIIAFNIPVGFLIWIGTGDFWKMIGFLVYSEVYNFSANFRGLSLHIENLLEYKAGKNI